MTQRLITAAVRKADLTLKSALFTGNYEFFPQVQPKSIEPRNFLSQMSSHPPKGFSQPTSQTKEIHSGAFTAGGIGADRKSSSLSGGADGGGDEKNSKGAPGSGGKRYKQIRFGFGVIAAICVVYFQTIVAECALETVSESIDEALQKGSNAPIQEITAGGNEKESVSAHLVQVVNAANSADHQIQFKAINSMRKMLTSGRNPPIDFLISCNIFPTLVVGLSSQNPDPQLDALFALTRIMGGTLQLTQAVVIEARAVPHFLIFLTSSPHQHVCENALSGLGNIIVDGPQLRDFAINLGVVALLLNCIHPDTPVTSLQKETTVISILCFYMDPPPTHQTVREIMPTMKLLKHHNDPILVLLSAWALMCLTGGGNKQIQMVIDSGVLPKLVQLLNHREVEVQDVAVRAVGNTSTVTYEPPGEEFQTQKAAALALSAIMTVNGNKEQVAHLIDRGLVPPFCNLLSCKDSGVSNADEGYRWKFSPEIDTVQFDTKSVIDSEC